MSLSYILVTSPKYFSECLRSAQTKNVDKKQDTLDLSVGQSLENVRIRKVSDTDTWTMSLWRSVCVTYSSNNEKLKLICETTYSNMSQWNISWTNQKITSNNPHAFPGRRIHVQLQKEQNWHWWSERLLRTPLMIEHLQKKKNNKKHTTLVS